MVMFKLNGSFNGFFCFFGCFYQSDEISVKRKAVIYENNPIKIDLENNVSNKITLTWEKINVNVPDNTSFLPCKKKEIERKHIIQDGK